MAEPVDARVASTVTATAVSGQVIVVEGGRQQDASPCSIATTVAREIEARAVVGLGKYGVTVADSPLSRVEWLQHAYEEACDLAVYLRKLIEMEGGT